MFDEDNVDKQAAIWKAIATIVGNAFWAECGAYPQPDKCQEVLVAAIEKYLEDDGDGEDTTTGGGELTVDVDYLSALDALSKDYASLIESKAK